MKGPLHPFLFVLTGLVMSLDIKEAWAEGRAALGGVSTDPELDARLLLQEALDRPHSYLLAHADDRLEPAQLEKYRHYLERARRSEPIPYITGHAAFYGREFLVTPAVLIPRPETEQLVDRALRWARGKDVRQAVDVGTGSGCIAVTLALELPATQVVATDVSTAALAVAQGNAARLAPGRVAFHEGHLLSPVAGATDLIVANLPYIAEGEWTLVDDAVKWYEPTVALKGGADGLDLIRELLQQAADRLQPVGALFMEIGYRQGPAVRELAEAIFPAAHVEVIADYAGRERIVMVSTG